MKNVDKYMVLFTLYKPQLPQRGIDPHPIKTEKSKQPSGLRSGSIIL